MDRRRELVLQRLSRIGSLAAAEGAPQNIKFKGRPTGAMTIEAAIGTYMVRNNEVYDFRRMQDTYTRSGKDSKEQLSRQMSEYMTAIEESQLANAKPGLAYAGHDGDILQSGAEEKLERILENDPSARYQLRRYFTRPADGGAQSAYDRLDANRCSGFLLYSYNKNGVHSVLGEHITPGSSGGPVTSREFLSNA